MKDSYKRSFSVKTFCDRNEVGKTTAYAEIHAGRLRALKASKRAQSSLKKMRLNG